MPYSPSSFNYSFADPFAGQFAQVANQGMDLARTGMDRGFGLADRRLDLTEAQQRWLQQYQQQQADRGFGLDQSRFGLEQLQADRGYGLERDRFGLTQEQARLQNELARQEEQRRANEANQALFSRNIQNVNSAFSSPAWQSVLNRNRPSIFDNVRTQASYVSPSIGNDGPGWGPAQPKYVYVQPKRKTSYDELGMEFSPV